VADESSTGRVRQNRRFSMKMSQKQMMNWAKTRQQGLTRYVWIYGVLTWGLTTGVMWAVVTAAMQGWEQLPFLLPVALIGFPIGGFFFGILTWKLAENQYEQATRDNPSPPVA